MTEEKQTTEVPEPQAAPSGTRILWRCATSASCRKASCRSRRRVMSLPDSRCSS